MGRNYFRGPGGYGVNMSLAKRTKLLGDRVLEIRADSTNVLNHPSFALPDKLVGPGHIGKITGTSVGARNMELIAKIRF